MTETTYGGYTREQLRNISGCQSEIAENGNCRPDDPRGCFCFQAGLADNQLTDTEKIQVYEGINYLRSISGRVKAEILLMVEIDGY